MRLVLLLFGVARVAWCRSVEPELERAVQDLQLRSGSLTSFKSMSLAQSRWEIGPLDALRPETDEIGFYRIIGSPLPPRHNESQLWDNLKFTLDTEPELERCKKIFVLNRLPVELETKVKSYIESKGFGVVVIPLVIEDYKPFQAADSYGLTKESWNPYLTEKFARLNSRLYVMNNNGARNFALYHGLQQGFAWTLPFDGNCIFDEDTWSDFLKELDESKARGAAYVAIPLMRTLLDESNNTLVRNGQPGEHQVAFTRTAKLQFDPTQPYGHRPKVNLLWRLGVPGAWDKWTRDAPFRSHGPCSLTTHHDCLRTLPLKNSDEAESTYLSQTVVYRLPDGLLKPGAYGGEDVAALRGRGELRDTGTIRKITQVDEESVSALIRPFLKPTYFNVVSMEAMRRECSVTKLMMKSRQAIISQDNLRKKDDENHHCSQIDDLLALAEKHLFDDTYSVVDKALSPNYQPPEGATVHDYQRLGLYDWRVSELPETIKVSDLRIPPELSGVTDQNFRDPEWRSSKANNFVGWDGHAREGADIWAEGSDQFDRTRSYDMMTNLTMQALAYFYSGKDEYAEKAARIARVWFCDPATAQSPNMNFAQFSKRPEKAHFGVIASKDLAYTLDALALIVPTKFWTENDDFRMQKWCELYLQWLDNSNERFSPNNHGWYYLTQYVAVAKFAKKPELFIFNKLKTHVDKYVTQPYITADGVFTLEAERSRGLHYHFFTAYAIILTYRALSNLGAKDLMDKISTLTRPTLTYLDNILSHAKATTCLGYDDEFKVTRRLQVSEEPQIRGCVPRAVAVEYAAPVCQFAFDDNATFAKTLTMCRQQGLNDENNNYPYLGTGEAFQNLNVPPFMPTYPHMGYFPFTNLMW